MKQSSRGCTEAKRQQQQQNKTKIGIGIGKAERERESKKRRISICTSELCQEQWNEKKSMRQTMKFQLIGRRAEMRFVPNTLKKQLKSKYAHTFSIFEHFKKTSARILCVMTGWEKRTKEFENLTKIKSDRFA